jgi:hypothetical protein
VEESNGDAVPACHLPEEEVREERELATLSLATEKISADEL